MRIRKARRPDWEEYLELSKKADIEMSRIIDINIRAKKEHIRKDFDDLLTSKKRILLVCKDDKNIIAYLIGTFIINFYVKKGYIDDIFVSKEYRKRGVGKVLINEFIKHSKKRKLKKCILAVSIKNKSAIQFYKKLGFKINNYEMERRF